MKKIRNITILLLVVAGFLLITACTGEVTDDPKPTENPLLGMDKVDRAILLYERSETISISSYRISQETFFVIEDSNNKIEMDSIAQTTVYDINGESFAEYIVGEVDVEGTKVKVEKGFVNGKEFNIIGEGAKMYASTTKEEYLNQRAEATTKLENNLKINRENCGTIDSYQNAEGNWIITAKDYSVSASKAIFEVVFEDIADLYGYTVAQCSVEVTILLMEDGTPCSTRITINTTPYDEYAIKLTLTDVSTYKDVNSVKAAPRIDLSGAFEVPSLGVFDDIFQSVSDITNAEKGNISIESKVVLSGDMRYSHTETNEITYSTVNGEYNMYDDIRIEIDNNSYRPTINEGYISYNGTTMEYNIGSETQNIDMDEASARALVFGMYQGAIPTEMDVTSYSLKKGSGYDALWFDVSQTVLDKALTSLNSMTGTNWSIISADGTYLIRVDAEGNVIYIKQTVSLTAGYYTYRVSFDVVNTIDFTK